MFIVFTGLNDGRDNRGRVTVMERGVPGSLISLEEWGGFYQQRAIFTELGVVENTNQQFMHTLGEWIYLYVFGDRIGQVNLSGVAFHDVCDGGSPEDGIGLSRVLSYYRDQRVARRENQLLLTIDPTLVLECFLIGIQARTLSTAEQMFQFNLSLALLPADDKPSNTGDFTGFVGDVNPSPAEGLA